MVSRKTKTFNFKTS